MDGEIASNRSVVQDQVIALRQTVTDSNEAQNPNIDMQNNATRK
ncbi:hypothetical protein [Listeria riparia]|nr:hypothetical protein [Listeria riparia]